MNKQDTAEDPFLGVFMILIGELLSGGMYVSEELFLKNVKIDPLLAVGIEGLAGFMYYIILLPILYFIPCYASNLCNDGHVEDTVMAFQQIGDNGWLMLL